MFLGFLVDVLVVKVFCIVWCCVCFVFLFWIVVVLLFVVLVCVVCLGRGLSVSLV